MSIFKPPFATAAELDAITLQEGELVWDSTNKNFRMGDGVTLGGVSDPTFIAAGLISDTTYNADQAAQDARLDVNEADIVALETAVGTLSNDNLLINSAFQIYQQLTTDIGSSPVSLGDGQYGHDMWKASGTTPTYSVTDGVVTFSQGGALYQENDILHTLPVGAEVTFSIQSGSVEITGMGATGVTVTPGSPHTWNVSGSARSITLTVATSGSFSYPKLEIGSEDTVYVIPDPAVSLTQCQYYYVPIHDLASVGNILAHGYATSTISAQFILNTIASVKSGGSIKGLGNQYDTICNGTDSAITIGTVTPDLVNATGITFTLSGTFSQYHPVYIVSDVGGRKIEYDARY